MRNRKRSMLTAAVGGSIARVFRIQVSLDLAARAAAARLHKSLSLFLDSRSRARCQRESASAVDACNSGAVTLPAFNKNSLWLNQRRNQSCLSNKSRLLAIGVAGALLAACGGGSGGSMNPPPSGTAKCQGVDARQRCLQRGLGHDRRQDSFHCAGPQGGGSNVTVYTAPSPGPHGESGGARSDRRNSRQVSACRSAPTPARC